MSSERAISELTKDMVESGINSNSLELKATINICSRKAEAMLAEVLNCDYYPRMSDSQLRYLMRILIKLVVSNVIYPYEPDPKLIVLLINGYRKEFEQFAADNHMMELMDESSLLWYMINYLSDLFYNLK